MKRMLCAALAAGLCVLSSQVEARRSTQQFQMPFGFDGRWMGQRQQGVRHATRSSRYLRRHRHMDRHRHFARRSHGRSVSYAGLPGPLAAKVNELKLNCGAVVISAHRPGARIAGTGRRSLHAIGRAVDMQGPSGCIYAHLQGWPGGYSTDYARMRHVHISYMPGGQEWGSRFVHGGYRTRYAKRRHFHYASISRH